ncbi:MAG: hypothetical protein DHS20C11_02410 [Lysobacteraceae bacterium]|nr:MAG: hypothetical protein DHS20C11_02410 [Xanthomonadaceae bacterium]
MTTLLGLLVLHGTFLALLLATVGRRRAPGNAVLAALVAVATILVAESYAGASGLLNRWPHLIGVFVPMWFLIGPLTYVYVQRFLRQQALRWPLVFLPAGLVALAMLPIYAMDGPEKLALQPSAGLTMAVYTLFWVLTAICAWSARSAISRQATTSDGGSRPAWHTAWLRFLLSLLLAYSAFDLALTSSLMLFGSYPPVAAYVTTALVAVLIYAVALLVVMPEGLMQRIPCPGKPYARSQLPDSVVRQLTSRLDQALDDRQLWRQDNLDHATLAHVMEITPHQLSQLFSVHLNTSFSELINQRRVQEAQRLLCDMSSRQSVMDIGLEAGFASNATFYRAFKKHTGMTPRQYLSSQASNDIESIRRA